MSQASTQLKTFLLSAVLSILLTTLVGATVASHVRITNAQTLSGTTFPPPIFYRLRSEPSYAITIPFTSLGKSPYEPSEISILVGMTVIWFNDDNGLHTVNTLTNSTYSPPEAIDSGAIPANGGSFIHSFSKPGAYYYYDRFDPSSRGQINVGATTEMGKNMNMMIGGNAIPFNPNEAKRVVLSFVPKTISIPPTIALTYNVTILDKVGKPLFSHRYDTADGILDIELVPTRKNPNSTEFITWGPDFRSQEAVRSTGTFHIEGPVLLENSEYSLKVAVVDKDNSVLSSPIMDTFVLPLKISQR
jgi:plastocyanin